MTFSLRSTVEADPLLHTNVARVAAVIPDPMDSDTFVRIEDKFLVPQAESESLKALVLEHCQHSYPQAGTTFTLIESIYFDSENLDLYQHHFSTMETRFKLRVRRYAPNGDWNMGVAFLEAKSKVQTPTGGVSSKKRFRIDPLNLNLLGLSQEILLTKELAALNPKLSAGELTDRIAFVNGLVKTYHLVPQLQVRYERMAFEGSDVRITMDKNINFKNLHSFSSQTSKSIRHTDFWSLASSMKSLYSSDHYFVCEVKHGGAIPSWLKQYFESKAIFQVSFSKYCWGLTNLLDWQEDSLR